MRVMALQGEYEPSKQQWVRDQVEKYEATGGREANTPARSRRVADRGDHLSGREVRQAAQEPRDAGRARRCLRRVASYGGSPEHPVWYHNFVAHPEVELQDGPEPHLYRARIAEGEERAIWWKRAVEQYAPYAEYQERTEREIPVFLLERVS